jgi:hypothetical protein
MQRRLLRLKGRCRLSLIYAEGLVQSVVFKALIGRLGGIFRLGVMNIGLLSY